MTRPGGVVLASVMATIGSMRCFLPGVAAEIDAYGAEAMDAVIRTGNLRHSPAGGTAAGGSDGGKSPR